MIGCIADARLMEIAELYVQKRMHILQHPFSVVLNFYTVPATCWRGEWLARQQHVHYITTLHVCHENESFPLAVNTETWLCFRRQRLISLLLETKQRSDSVAVGTHDNTSSPS